MEVIEAVTTMGKKRTAEAGNGEGPMVTKKPRLSSVSADMPSS